MIDQLLDRLRALGFEATYKPGPVRRPTATVPAVDFSELSEKEFERVLNKIQDIRQLEGLANRRRWLRAPELKRWNEAQLYMIKKRKLELEAGNKKGKR